MTDAEPIARTLSALWPAAPPARNGPAHPLPMQEEEASEDTMNTGVPLSQAAKYFEVDQVTIRRWLKDNCPCIRRGRRGPGQGALLDLQQVAQWRGKTRTPEMQTPRDAMQTIAKALWQALDEDRADIRAGVSKDDAAAVLIVAWERIGKNMGQTYPFDQQPDAIQTLMSVL